MKGSGLPLKEFRPASVSWVRRSSIASSTKRISTEIYPSVESTTDDHSHQTPSELGHVKDLTSIDDSKNEQQAESTACVRIYSTKSIYLTKDLENINENKEQNESIETEIKPSINQQRPVSVSWVKRDSIHSLSNKSIQKNNSFINRKDRIRSAIENPQIENLIPSSPLFNQKDKSNELIKSINGKNHRYIFIYLKFFFILDLFIEQFHFIYGKIQIVLKL